MRAKKFLISFAVVILACLLVLGGTSMDIKRKIIRAQERSYAEVIEYENEETNSDIVNVDGEVIEDETVSDSEIDDKVEQSEEVSICVFGKSKVSLSPDLARISACIEIYNTDMVKAKEENFSNFEGVIDALKELGIDKDNIILDHFSCYPNHDYEQGRRVVGYYSTTSFSVKLDNLEKIKECVNVMTEKGVTNINNIVYEVSDIDEQYNNALSSAVENSKAKAVKLLGREDLNIVSIKEEYVYSSNNLYRNYAEDLSASDLIGKIDIEARVLVEFN